MSQELIPHLNVEDAVSTGDLITALEPWLEIRWDFDYNIKALRKILKTLNYKNFEDTEDVWLISPTSLIFYEQAPIIQPKPEPNPKTKGYDLKKIMER